jgi:hypothetical protein
MHLSCQSHTVQVFESLALAQKNRHKPVFSNCAADGNLFLYGDGTGFVSYSLCSVRCTQPLLVPFEAMLLTATP